MAMNATEARKEIARIDRLIDANHRELRSLERFNSLSAAGWQAAWDKHPELHEAERNLYRQRGEAQDQRDNADHAEAMRTARTRRVAIRRHRCATCGSLVAA